MGEVKNVAKSQKPKDPDAVNERYRITIPEADDVARRWAATQSNLSLSLRILIRKCVLDLGGYEDVAMRELNMPIKRGPGRPRKDAAKLLSGQAVPVPPRPPSLLSGPVVQPTQAPAPEPPTAAQPPSSPPTKGTIDDIMRTGSANGHRGFQSPLAAGILEMGSDN